MKRLYQIHRWAGIALALFMLTWFSSGLVIMYAKPSALTQADQLALKESLRPESGWLSLGQAWQNSAEQRQAPARLGSPEHADAAPAAKEDWIVEARLVRHGQQPYWLIETGQERRLAISAVDGNLHTFSAGEAEHAGLKWLDREATLNGETGENALQYLDTGPQDSSVRNLDALRPFHRFAVGGSGRQLLISARTGEVVRDTTPLARAMYWVGNWVHLLRPLDSIGLKDQRQSVLAWLGGIAFAASLTGIIIGLQRWRPGWGGRPTYSQGRKHPYRDVWNTWHFWTGLIGGTAALLWAFSGYLSTNPFQVFSPANATKPELRRYQGTATPNTMLDWQPTSLSASADEADVVELVWRHLGTQAVLLAVTREGRRTSVDIGGSMQPHIDTVTEAARRLAGKSGVMGHELITDYDSYYYPRHRQSALDRPLPVLRVDLADEAATRLYIDPQDGQLLLKQDASRRTYRWLYSALHHWDFGWLYRRPVWDAWMLPLVLMGVVLGGTAVVLGWKRLRLEYRTAQKKRQKQGKRTLASHGARLRADVPDLPTALD
jgi:uncharacterized iron-regulated membrane protein